MRNTWARGLGALLVVAAVVYVGAMHGTAGAQSTDTASPGSTISPQASSGSSVDTYRAQLQSQLNALNAQIAQQQTILTQTQSQATTLANAIKILTAQITQAQLAIKVRTITIEQLTEGITDKENSLFGLNSQLNAEKDSLAAILREKSQLESTSLVIAMLSSQSLSDFFSDLDTFDSINASLQQSFAQISSTTVITQAAEADLETQREQETQLLEVQQLQEQQIQQQQDQKNQLLSETKGQEKAYQALIASNQKSAAQIQAALFQLNGSAAIPFDKALQYADIAEQQTGIRPAFLLGIIAEESNLGQNVGTGSWQVDMNPTRDVPIFKAIAASLGLDPNTLPVSARQWYGWGGAMGPAQFIPSTWALYAGYVKPTWQYDSSKDRIGKRTGDTPPNPWSPKDAFMAAALYLTDDGAGAQTSSAEFRAAMCYLAGCGSVNNTSLQFYGNSVASLAAKYQQEINIINGS